MRRIGLLVIVSLVAAGCGASRSTADRTGARTGAAVTRAAAPKARAKAKALPAAARILHLKPVPPGPLPGYLLIADRNNDRIVIVSPSKRVVWSATGLHSPDDAFFTPGYRSVITNEEFNDTLTQVSLATGKAVWRYGHAGVPGSSPGYLNTPDDAYRLPGGDVTVADIKNCRIVRIAPSGKVVRVLGGSCVHDPPRGFASPNGDTPLPDGGLLVTEIGGWIDRLDKAGRLLWSVRSPVYYPSDAQLLPNGRILVSSFTVPGKIVEMTRSGRVTWSFGAASGPNMLNKPSLAVRLPNGMIAANDDYNHRVIVIDPRTKRIVWQYGHTGVAGSAPGYLSKPDGIDLLSLVRGAATAPTRTTAALHASAPARVARIGSLPSPTERIAAVALPRGRVLAVGGLVGGSSSDQVLLGPPGRLRPVGHLPVATHDDAAVLSGGAVLLYGGGQATSSDRIVRIDPRTGAAGPAGRLPEPLSDLGAATVGGRVYLVGGYTGTQFATAVLRVRRGGAITVVTRLPAGLRYAGVAALGGRIYVAGGLTTQGESDRIWAVDPRAGTLSAVGRLPAPVAHAPLVPLRGALYLFGGTSAAGTPLDQVLRIDPRTGATRRVATLPRPLADAAAVPVGRRAIVLGGRGSDAVLAFTP